MWHRVLPLVKVTQQLISVTEGLEPPLSRAHSLAELAHLSVVRACVSEQFQHSHTLNKAHELDNHD